MRHAGISGGHDLNVRPLGSKPSALDQTELPPAIGKAGFEPAISGPPDRRLRPDLATPRLNAANRSRTCTSFRPQGSRPCVSTIPPLPRIPERPLGGRGPKCVRKDSNLQCQRRVGYSHLDSQLSNSRMKIESHFSLGRDRLQRVNIPHPYGVVVP